MPAPSAAPAETPATAPTSAPAAALPAPVQGQGIEPAAAPEPTVVVSSKGQKDKDKDKVGEEIVITGSRIRRKDLTTPAPVTMLNREQIAASGKVSIGDFLQSIPEQGGNASNTSVNNGGDGSTVISLRNLGEARTLVLINGRRAVPSGTGANDSVDLNSIPSAAVERIEILKDGASALYGSDAVGGVVNIITRKKFDGVEASIYTGTSSHSDGSILDVNLTGGTSNDKGSIMFSAGYYKQQPVWADNRSWSHPTYGFDATGLNNPEGQGPGEYSYGNSNTVPAGTVSIPQSKAGQAIPNPDNDPKIDLYNKLVTKYPTATKFIHDSNSEFGWRPFVPSVLPPNGDSIDVAPYNYLVTPQQRISLFSTGQYKLSSLARAYFEAYYVNRQSEIQLAAEPLATANYDFPLTASKDSMYNPFHVDFTTFNRRLVEFGDRKHDIEVNTARIVTGVDGTLPKEAGPLEGWFWDLSLNFGRTNADETRTGSILLPNLSNALGPSYNDPLMGPTCGTKTNPIKGCVPLDIFDGQGTITPEMVRYLAYAGSYFGTNQMLALQANLNGDIVKLPWADRAIALAAGYEYRRLTGSNYPDPIAAAGWSSDGVSAVTSGGYYVNEGYAELSLPLITHVPLIENLEATAAARAFRYSAFGGDWTYKLGGRYSPVKDLTIRGTYSTAFRAPSISDLYSGLYDNNPPVSDPCSGLKGPPPPSCGAAANNGDDRSQLTSKKGGNPNLTPETAKIYTLGTVLQPRWVKNLSVTVDYYNVDITNTITTLGDSLILASCYPDDPAATPKYCDHIVRDDKTHQIIKLINTEINAGSEKTSGIDIGLRYILPTRQIGRFLWMFDANWLNNYDITQPDGTVVHARGSYDLATQSNGGQGGVLPAWRFTAGVIWNLAGFTAAINTKFMGSFTECGDSNGDFSGSGVCSVDNTYQRKISAWSKWDLNLGYDLNTAIGTTSIAGGVQNVFDAAPARIYNGFTSTSDPTGYDFMGRFFYLRLTQRI